VGGQSKSWDARGADAGVGERVCCGAVNSIYTMRREWVRLLTFECLRPSGQAGAIDGIRGAFGQEGR
jgi:hypothetical protein